MPYLQGYGEGQEMSIDDIPRSEWECLILEWVKNERDRKILIRRYLDGLTFDCLADEFDMSVQNVKHICYKQWDKVTKHVN